MTGFECVPVQTLDKSVSSLVTDRSQLRTANDTALQIALL